MRNYIKRKIRTKPKAVTGLLVLAPTPLRGDDIDFLLIGEDGIEYHLMGNRKTFKMWNLIDTKVEVSGFILDEGKDTCKLKTVTFKCIDDFVDTESLPIYQFDEFGFDISRFDYAI